MFAICQEPQNNKFLHFFFFNLQSTILIQINYCLYYLVYINIYLLLEYFVWKEHRIFWLEINSSDGEKSECISGQVGNI